MKRTLAIILVLLLGISLLAGCGSKSVEPTSVLSEKPDDIPTSEPTASLSQTPESEFVYDPEKDDDQGRFSGGSFSETVGDYTISAEWVPFAESLPREEKSDARIAVIGDAYYVLVEGVIRQYKLENGGLMFEKEMPLPEDSRTYKALSSDDNGVLYISGQGSDFSAYVDKDSEPIFLAKGYSVSGTVQMHPSGEWGINSSGQKVIRDGDTFKIDKDWTWSHAEDMKTISEVSVSQNHIFIGGWTNIVKNEELKINAIGVFVYDLEGNRVAILREDEEYDGRGSAPGSMGAPHGVVETRNGFIVSENNFNNLVFYKHDGTFIGEIDTRKLFGIDHSRNLILLRTPAQLPDGSFLYSVIVERPDAGGDEVIVCRVSGF